MSDGEITQLLRRIDNGDDQAAGALLDRVYGELRSLAAAKMARESPGQTLQPTALVHEAWLRLGGDAQPAWQNRSHFFAAAAECMRRILVDNARRKQARRHGGGLAKVSADDTAIDLAAPENSDEIIQVHEALEALASSDPRKAELVKLRYFAGMSFEEAAAALEISVSTAKRDWSYARAWLLVEIKRQHGATTD